MRRKLLALLLVLLLIPPYVLYSWYSSYANLFTKKPVSEVLVKGSSGTVVVEGYKDDPLRELNLTVYHVYDRVIIVPGSDAVKSYCDRTGKCQYLLMAVSEVSCIVGKILGAHYYETSREAGYNSSRAKMIAFERVSKSVSTLWLSMGFKLSLGRGSAGNGRVLVVIFRGPLDGAEKNRIYSPRRGVLVFEGRTYRDLYSEALIFGALTGIKC